MVEKGLGVQLKYNTKVVKPILVLFFISATVIGTTILLPFQTINAQNVTVQIENATTADQVTSSVIENLAQPGFGNKYDIISNGTTVPISYNIIGGTVVGILGDPQRHALYVAVNPGSDRGALEVNLPRNIIDSKTSANTDRPFVVMIDGDRISGEPTGICIGTCPNIFNSFKETETSTDRVLTVIFGPESRFIEIVGTRGI